ncbi:MAG TPA: hypothetical protein VIV15_09155, partial [Anaerolineales bacterium]
ERNQELTRKGIGFIRDNPALIASFALAKLIDFWNPFLKGDVKALFLLNIASYGILTLLAFVGLIRRVSQRSLQSQLVLIWALIGYYMIQAMVFTGGGKARLPIEPFLVLLGSDVLWIMLTWARARSHYSRAGLSPK